MPVLRHEFDLALGRAEWSGISEVPGIHQALALTKFCFVSSSEKTMPDRNEAVGLLLGHYGVSKQSQRFEDIS
jgi:hypothetical protein